VLELKNSVIYAGKTLRQTFRSKEKVGLIFAVPILLLVSLAFMYGEQSSMIPVAEDDNYLNIGVLNWDNTTVLSPELKTQFEPHITTLNAEMNVTGDPLETGFGTCFIENINQSNHLLTAFTDQKLSVSLLIDLEQAKTAVQSRQITLCFVITENFSRTILAGINYRTYLTTGSYLANTSNLLRSDATVELIGDYSYSRFSEAQTILAKMLKAYVHGYTELELPGGGKFELRQEQINSIEFSEFDTYIPGFLIFTLLMSVSGSAGILAAERGSGTLDRLKLGALSPSSLVMGISITQFITTSLEIVVYLLTIYYLGFPGKGNPVFAFLIGLITIPPILGVGLISAVAFKDEMLAMSVPGTAGIPLSFLSGAFIPLPKMIIFGEVEIWHVNPLYSASEAIRKILFYEYTLSQVFLEITLVLAVGSGVFLLGAYFFYRTVYRSD